METAKTLNPYALIGSMPITTKTTQHVSVGIEIKTRLQTNQEKQLPPLALLVAQHFSVPAERVFVRTRKREVVGARQVIMSEMKKRTKYTLQTIGSAFVTEENPKGYDHATVLHAIKTVNNLCETDKEFRGIVEKIDADIEKENLWISL